MKRAALYARVSTTGHGQDPELQLRELRLYCQQHGLQNVGEYVDLISSSKVRPQQQQLMADARESSFDLVLVWKFDRWARSTIELNQTLEELKRLNVNFVSLTEQIDTATPAGKLVFTILGAVAEMEKSLIQERVRAGLRNAVAKGKRLGRPPCTISMETVRTCVDNCGGSVTKAARALGLSYGKTYQLNHRARKYNG